MAIDARRLKRYQHPTAESSGAAEGAHPPTDTDVLIGGMGNSGEGVALRMQALAYHEGVSIPVFGLNNDELSPRPLAIRGRDRTETLLSLTNRLIFHDDHPRDQVRDYPLLAHRYRRLLRGIPVLETYPRAGHGGHGHPVISALDMDLHIDALLAFLRQMLRQVRDEPPDLAAARSDWERLRLTLQQRQGAQREKRIILIGGGSGSMGNAGHHLVPYLLRSLLADLGIQAYELWGVILGPRAFTALTPFVQHNYRALLESLEHLTVHGCTRDFVNGLHLALPCPPYDRVFLMDDPRLPSAGTKVTEEELDTFLDQTALSLTLLLQGNVVQTIDSHLANPEQSGLAEGGQLRYLQSVRGVVAGVNLDHLSQLLAAHLTVQMVQTIAQRMAA
ncbi:MAG: hypothetical protein HC884_06020 [Chloroflexaceae bacterium]|nr:hypothetical protein [Chloroflexaceae bacterium]